MSAEPSDFDQICPDCGSVNGSSAMRCGECGCNLGPNVQLPRDRAAARAPSLERLGPIIKVAVPLAVVALIAWGLYAAAQRLWRDVTESSPYPKNPVETATEFFTSLQGGTDEDYQQCYVLLNMGRKVATAIGKHSRAEGYFPHFERIRRYLAAQAGDDFASTMLASEDGRHVEFGNDVVLTLAFEVVKGLDEQNHYALREINEFPIDVLPSIGLERRNRGLNRAIDTLGAVTEDGSDADASEIIRRRDHETKMERRARLIDAFGNARQLDTRHTLLEWIIKEFPGDPTTRRMLSDLADSADQPPNLRALARQTLAYWNGQ